jgi:membrane protease subunit (stomatin/prohibitin family)
VVDLWERRLELSRTIGSSLASVLPQYGATLVGFQLLSLTIDPLLQDAIENTTVALGECGERARVP